eukprot:SAG31_NODE_14780_length_788_cov_0.711176_1_plen_165_part_10
MMTLWRRVCRINVEPTQVDYNTFGGIDALIPCLYCLGVDASLIRPHRSTIMEESAKGTDLSSQDNTNIEGRRQKRAIVSFEAPAYERWDSYAGLEHAGACERPNCHCHRFLCPTDVFEPSVDIGINSGTNSGAQMERRQRRQSGRRASNQRSNASRRRSSTSGPL